MTIRLLLKLLQLISESLEATDVLKLLKTAQLFTWIHRLRIRWFNKVVLFHLYPSLFSIYTEVKNHHPTRLLPLMSGWWLGDTLQSGRMWVGQRLQYLCLVCFPRSMYRSKKGGSGRILGVFSMMKLLYLLCRVPCFYVTITTIINLTTYAK